MRVGEYMFCCLGEKNTHTHITNSVLMWHCALYLGAGWRVETTRERAPAQQLAVGAPVRNWKHRSTHWASPGCSGVTRGAWLGVKLIAAADRSGTTIRVWVREKKEEEDTQKISRSVLDFLSKSVTVQGVTTCFSSRSGEIWSLSR